MKPSPLQLTLCATLASAAYAVTADSRFAGGMPITKLLKGKKGQVRGFIAEDSTLRAVAFSGTETLQDILTDLNVLQVPTRLFRTPVTVHAGFLDEYDALREQLDVAVDARPLLVTGHSLGGALATLAALGLAQRGASPIVCAFGSPRVGGWGFSKLYNTTVPATLRVVHDNDAVPQVPKAAYWHVDRLLHLRNDGSEIRAPKRLWAWVRNQFFSMRDTLSGDGVREHAMTGYREAVNGYANRVALGA